MKHQLTGLFTLITALTASAQTAVEEHYLRIPKATYKGLEFHEDGSFDVTFDQTYRFDASGAPSGQGAAADETEKKAMWRFAVEKSGRNDFLDTETGIEYCLAPEIGSYQWQYGRILVRYPDGKEKTIEYDDPDAKMYSERHFVHGSTLAHKGSEGKIFFVQATGGTCASGPAERKKQFDNYVKIYTLDPDTRIVEQAVGLINKVPIPATTASGEGYIEDSKHGELLGVIGDQLIVVYDYTEGVKTGKRTVDIWSIDLVTFEEKRLSSEQVAISDRTDDGYSLSRSGDDKTAGLFYAFGIAGKSSDGLMAAYTVFQVTPEVKVVPIRFAIPAVDLKSDIKVARKENNYWFPPFLSYFITGDKLVFYASLDEEKQQESTAIFACSGLSGNPVSYRLEQHTKGLDEGAMGIFTEKGMSELGELYQQESPYADKENSCPLCEVVKHGYYYVDAEKQVHFVIVEYLLTRKVCTNCGGTGEVLGARVRTAVIPE